MSTPSLDARPPRDAARRSEASAPLNPTLRERLMSWGVRAFVMCLYAGLVLMVGSLRALRRGLGLGTPSRESDRKLLLTGTFYNVGWFRSHILPFSLCRSFDEVIVVTDEELFPVEKVRYACPSPLLTRLIGRSLARVVCVGRVAFRDRPGMLMGYHIMPNGLMCLAFAAITGARSSYQNTSGPIQLVGGGVGSDNALLRWLRKDSALREALLYRLVRAFDLLVVRGRHTGDFVKENRLGSACITIPGSVDCERFTPGDVPKTYDLIGVGRLVPVKRWERFLAVVAELRKRRPDVRTAIVGGGVLMERFTEQARALGIEASLDLLGQHDDVPGFLRRGKLWLLTSESEGLSIAMMEAMAVGLPVLAPDIGELGEMLIDGETGLFVDVEDPASTAERIAELLADPPRLARMSEAARRLAVAESSIPAVARKWEAYFGGLPEPALSAAVRPVGAPLPRG